MLHIHHPLLLCDFNHVKGVDVQHFVSVSSSRATNCFTSAANHHSLITLSSCLSLLITQNLHLPSILLPSLPLVFSSSFNATLAVHWGDLVSFASHLARLLDACVMEDPYRSSHVRQTHQGFCQAHQGVDFYTCSTWMNAKRCPHRNADLAKDSLTSKRIHVADWGNNKG